MNELQLHSRLSDLADDLAPGDDPYELVAGARALHRRRRRARMGVAGAALAVALVAVGVPTAVHTLSAPDRGDGATPMLPTEGPAGAAERLRSQADAVRAVLENQGVDGSVPGASAETPCPDAMTPLSSSTGLTVHGQLGDAVPRAQEECLWSTSPDPANPAVPATERLDASARFTPGTTAEDLVRRLDRDVAEDCEWTTVLDGGTFDALQFCAGPGTATWTVLLVDEAGTGAWELTSTVGPQFSLESPTLLDLGPTAVGAVWAGVANTPEAPDVEPGVPDESLVRPLDDVRAGFLRVGAGPVPDPANDVPCPDVAERLGAATGMFEVEPAATNAGYTTTGGCEWATDADGAAPGRDDYHLSLIAFPEMTGTQLVSTLEETAEEDGCTWAEPLPREEFLTTLELCVRDDFTLWYMAVADEDGTGVWQLSSTVGAEMPEPYGLGTSGLTSLWDVVRNVLPGDDLISPLNRSFNDVVNGFDARSRPVRLSAPSTAMSCPELPAGLADRTNSEPTEVRGPGGSLTCTWESAAGATFSIGFIAGATPRVYRDAPDVTFEEVPGSDAATTCLGVVLPGTEPAGGLAACGLADHEQWRLDMADAGGRGVWRIGLRLPSSGDPESADAVRALIELADARW